MDLQSHLSMLQPALEAAARRAYTEVRERHASETFYAFGLITSGAAAFIPPAANTEEALRRRFGRRVDPNEEPWLRWYPSEWEYLYEGKQHFAEVQGLLQRFDPYDRTMPRSRPVQSRCKPWP